MEAQDRINEQPESGIRDDAPFETDGPADETTDTEDQEPGQPDLRDRDEDAFEAAPGAGERTQFEDPEDGQLDLRDRKDEPTRSVDLSNQPVDSEKPEEPQVETEERTDGQSDAGDPGDALLESESRVSVQLDHLIGEIDRAVGIIRQLRQQTAELNQRNRELQELLENKDQEISGLQAERQRLKSIYDSNASLIANKEEIQRKIDTMISRLDSVNTA